MPGRGRAVGRGAPWRGLRRPAVTTADAGVRVRADGRHGRPPARAPTRPVPAPRPPLRCAAVCCGAVCCGLRVWAGGLVCAGARGAGVRRRRLGPRRGGVRDRLTGPCRAAVRRGWTVPGRGRVRFPCRGHGVPRPGLPPSGGPALVAVCGAESGARGCRCRVRGGVRGRWGRGGARRRTPVGVPGTDASVSGEVWRGSCGGVARMRGGAGRGCGAYSREVLVRTVWWRVSPVGGCRRGPGGACAVTGGGGDGAPCGLSGARAGRGRAWRARWGAGGVHPWRESAGWARGGVAGAVRRRAGVRQCPRPGGCVRGVVLRACFRLGAGVARASCVEVYVLWRAGGRAGGRGGAGWRVGPRPADAGADAVRVVVMRPVRA